MLHGGGLELACARGRRRGMGGRLGSSWVLVRLKKPKARPGTGLRQMMGISGQGELFEIFYHLGFFQQRRKQPKHREYGAAQLHVSRCVFHLGFPKHPEVAETFAFFDCWVLSSSCGRKHQHVSKTQFDVPVWGTLNGSFQ